MTIVVEATPPATPLVGAGTVHLVGLTLFVAGIALGTLLVFTDRHGYERPIPPRLVGGCLAVGTLLFALGWIGLRAGL